MWDLQNPHIKSIPVKSQRFHYRWHFPFFHFYISKLLLMVFHVIGRRRVKKEWQWHQLHLHLLSIGSSRSRKHYFRSVKEDLRENGKGEIFSVSLINWHISHDLHEAWTTVSKAPCERRVSGKRLWRASGWTHLVNVFDLLDWWFRCWFHDQPTCVWFG